MLRGLTTALAALLLGGLTCNFAAAQPPMPGKPRASVVSVHEDSADLRIRWAPPADTPVRGYLYRAGASKGGGWSASGQADQAELELSGVPLARTYWICVKAVTETAGTSEDRCNSFSTPAGPPPQPAVARGGPAGVRECEQRRPEWIWCDDFEHDRLVDYFEASMPRRQGVGRDGSFGVVGRYRPGKSEAGNLKLAFGRTPHPRFHPVDDGARDYREIYWRVWLRNPDGWRGGGGDKLSRATVLAGENRQQAMIAHIWSDRDGSGRQSYLKIDPVSGTDGNGRVRTTRYNDFDNFRWIGARLGKTPIFSSEHLGRWHCIEAHVRLNDKGKSNGAFRLWVDGQLEAARTDLNWLDDYEDYGINAVFLENYWNKTSPVVQERYMDNFVVSTQPIGCG